MQALQTDCEAKPDFQVKRVRKTPRVHRSHIITMNSDNKMNHHVMTCLRYNKIQAVLQQQKYLQLE